MIRSLSGWRARTALLAVSTALLAACGGSGSSSDGTATIRVLNATSDVSSVDVYLGDTKSFSADTIDTLTSNVGVSSNTYDIKVTSAGNTSSLLTGSYSLAKDLHYTGLVWGRSGALRFVTLPEDEDTTAIATSNARVRIYNATTDAGTLDVYLTQNQDDLSSAAPTGTTVAASPLGGYRDVAAGTYRLRITGTGNVGDLRLDIPAVTLGAQKYVTLIITPGPGSVLVNAALLEQQGALGQFKNTQSRVRVVAGVEAQGTTASVVSVVIDGKTLVAGQRSPSDGSYNLLGAGSHVVDVRVNGTSISSTSRSFAAGGDYTMLAYGTAATGQVQVVADDNRLPLAGRYKVRLINGSSTAGLVNLQIDNQLLVPDVPLGTASSFVTGASATSVEVIVLSTSGATTLFDKTDQSLASQGVYTMFVLGGATDTVTGLPSPRGILRKDR